MMMNGIHSPLRAIIGITIISTFSWFGSNKVVALEWYHDKILSSPSSSSSSTLQSNNVTQHYIDNTNKNEKYIEKKKKYPMIPNEKVPLRKGSRIITPKIYYEDDYKQDYIMNALHNKSINEYTKSELIQMENKYALLHSLNENDKKIFTHFLVHIPKTAGYHVFSRLHKLAYNIARPKLNAMGIEKHYKPCNVGVNLVKYWDKEFQRETYGEICNMWMTEQPVQTSNFHHHAYTLIRNPYQHVVSQYFHCKESSDHKVFGQPELFEDVTLDDWLDYHVERTQYVPRATETNYGPPFGCYDPINLQSLYTDYDLNVTEKELDEQFEVIGDMDQMGKSVCAISTRYMGYLPPACDCSDSRNNNLRRRQVKENEDHGVKHHGATFQLTDAQKEKIAKITTLDRSLHEKVKRVFAKQVMEIEKEFNVQLCDKPKFSDEYID